MPAPTEAELLRHIAREEPLIRTAEAFGVSRAAVVELLERMAARLEPVVKAPASGKAPASPSEFRPSPSATPSASSASSTTPRAGAMKVYSDGAARGNPGPAGAGAVLIGASGEIVERLGKFLGIQTNNHAEYSALLLGLRRARELGVQDVEVYADSELMIRQLEGRYQVKSPTLRPLYEDAKGLLRGFRKVKLVHVPREQNAEADEMSNRAIDERMG